VRTHPAICSSFAGKRAQRRSFLRRSSIFAGDAVYRIRLKVAGLMPGPKG